METYFLELWLILKELAPPFLLGLAIAGILHIFVPRSLFEKNLSKPNFSSVLKATLMGVPMPLCSCGVVPTAIGLRNKGASKGATTGFLISTPQTGADSILVSASFLGWPFALFAVGATFFTGLLGGLLVNWFDKAPAGGAVVPESRTEETGHRATRFFQYVVKDLLASIDLWLAGGIVVAALLSTFVPVGYLYDITWIQGFGGMLLMLAISLPLYVCTTSSIPIAAGLIAAGMPLGAALVFLMAGPTTNVATLGAVYRGLGGRVLAIYLTTVAVMSLVLGYFFNFLLPNATAVAHMHHEHGIDWLGVGSAILLLALLAYTLGLRVNVKIKSLRGGPGAGANDLVLQVQGMTCRNCVAIVKNTLEAQPGVILAAPDLATGSVLIQGSGLEREALRAAVERAGYRVTVRE